MTENEYQSNYPFFKSFLKRKLLPVPDSIKELLHEENSAEPTDFSSRKVLLSEPKLQPSVGCSTLKRHRRLVCVSFLMPGVSMDMMNWWLWWYPQASVRYRLWLPDSHVEIKYASGDKEYFARKEYPGFKPTTQRVVFLAGGKKHTRCVKHVSVEEFGFDRETIQNNGISGCSCAHIYSAGGLFKISEAAHIFRETDKGLLVISHIWLGQGIPGALLRKLTVTAADAADTAEYCYRALMNLSEIIVPLYNKYAR